MGDRAAFVTIGVLSLVVVGLVGVLMTSGGATRPATFDVGALPLVNACLNTISAGLLVAGWLFIRRRRVVAHVSCMLGAFAVSTLLLLSYVTYHYHAGSRPFGGQGPIRIVYFAVLISHVILAAVIPPLAGLTLWRGLTSRFDRHVRIARWTLPLWLYVSVTGVLVFWMVHLR